jgi:hypothetical protein
MRCSFFPAWPAWVIALAATPLAACGGAAAEQRPFDDRIAAPAIAAATDAGTPEAAPAPAEAPVAAAAIAEPATPAEPEPIAASGIDPAPAPSGPAAAAPPEPSALPAPPDSPCAALRAAKRRAPLFAPPTLPCDRADRILYYRSDAGHAGGACGSSIALAIEADGRVSRLSAGAGNAGACADAEAVRTAVDAGEARRLVAASCAAVNEAPLADRGVGCRERAVRLFVFAGDDLLGATAALPCPPHGLDGAVAELDALAARLR